MLDFGFYNMDCMEGMKQFPDNYFDLAIVDPPYGGVTQGGYMANQMSGGIAKNRNDYHLSLWQCDRPSEAYFKELKRVSKNQVIWGGNYYASMLKDSQCWLVWDKVKPEGVSFADVELAYTSFDLASRLFQFAWNGMIQGDMKHKEHKIHPTQKPVALYKWILNNYAKEGDLILDTHVGSASSLIACEDLGFKYVGFELDETYYKESKERLENHKAQISIMELMRDWKLP
jgi:site-specific DNA-methyltransferase (adenine-specific)